MSGGRLWIVLAALAAFLAACAGAAAPRATPGAEAVMTRARVITVGKGDTLYALSERYQVALRPLIELNDLRAPFTLKAGQPLTLPAPNVYRARWGESLRDIAEAHRVHYNSLIVLNRLSWGDTVTAGTLVLLPSLARDWRAALAASAAPAMRPVPKGAIDTSLTGTFTWPVDGQIVQRFNPRARAARTTGVKISARRGAPVRAASDGAVVYAGDGLQDFGNLVLIQHSNGWVSAYGHGDRLTVREGDRVRRGDVVARAGETGAVSGAQVHFELRRNGAPVDPLSVLPRRT